MKKIFGFALMAVAMLSLTACTDNTIARKWGGSMTVELKEGERLVNVTWKAPENSLWILTKQNAGDTPPSVYKFKEDSRWGIIEGTVTIIEK
jgi:hypothetical protein